MEEIDYEVLTDTHRLGWSASRYYIFSSLSFILLQMLLTYTLKRCLLWKQMKMILNLVCTISFAQAIYSNRLRLNFFLPKTQR